MIIKIKVPSPGESITEIEVSSWNVKNGDYVEKNQVIAEVDSDKATLEIIAEESGVISSMKEIGKKLKVGDTLCIINTSTNNNRNDKFFFIEKNSSKKEEIIKNYPSPSSKKILSEKNIPLESIKGSGKDGRITKKDCLIVASSLCNKKKGNNNSIIKKQCRNKKITPLSSLRRKISERLVSIKNRTAMLTTFNEVDMKNVFIIRKKYKNIFKDKHGVNLGFMSFFTKSCVRALSLYPDVNAMISGIEKINFNYCDISIAISGPKGLMVPVIRNAENLSFREIEKKIKILSTRVHDGKISIEEMTGGTFTITNGGIFGSMLSTPIINPPQSAILGMHNIIERPVVINGLIEIRPIMYLALSYDHRIIDGRESVGFLLSIKESIENPIKFIMGGDEKNIHSILEL
ncbi:2-oxoglutarate dehydrogenase complex dihydrolipoyllysine-residue succinyltransferase [Blattabacterium cuenoti]|uniref:2-oxoglutarate dehydrogenase complex dihydrolipoyllysine-residue succinyltransferase n=1 Tax=Blattabacterium cuenoti TaxID=1653831 RepID=UPI00163D3945|nr:2-oxoglutarate dehydrogenase complex dihydrolipoyllysine-residue succinyltransferase [Blattabacterium cuenoti]